jgi:hypothetical protein
VHVGEIEERPLGFGGLLVKTALDWATGGGTRERVRRERSGGAAEHVARKLVEHADKRQRTSRTVLRVAERSGNGRPVDALEFGVNLSVHGDVFHEPSLRAQCAPIDEHIAGRRQRVIGRPHNLTSPDTIS